VRRHLGISTIGALVLILCLLVLFSVLPSFPYSASWGYGPSSLAALVLILVVILLVIGKL
jgi:hypothetical protein